MHKIKLILSAITVFAMGMLGAKAMSDTGEDHEFNNYGQFSPKYVGKSDSQMLSECEKHGLIYDYDMGRCLTKYEWRMHEAEKQGSADGS